MPTKSDTDESKAPTEREVKNPYPAADERPYEKAAKKK